MTRIEQLADAFIKVAKANHYMVGIVAKFTKEELDGAKQILINYENDNPTDDKYRLALDIVEGLYS